MDEVMDGNVVSYKDDGFLIYVPYGNRDRALLRRYKQVRVGFIDSRTITDIQRRKAYALMYEISCFVGETPEQTKDREKWTFILKRLEAIEVQFFSLANCSVTLARKYITFLIDVIIENNMPTKKRLYELSDDLEHYMWACLVNRKCAVCGTTYADLHHADRVGMGRNRDEIFQLGMGVQSLCRIHHSECHAIGQDEFDKQYHFVTVPLTPEIGKIYGLTKKNLEVTYASEVG